MKKFTVEYRTPDGQEKTIRGKAESMDAITDQWAAWSRFNITGRGPFELISVCGGWS